MRNLKSGIKVDDLLGICMPMHPHVYHALPTAGKTVAAYAVGAIDSDAVLEHRFGSWSSIDEWYATHSEAERYALARENYLQAKELAESNNLNLFTNYLSPDARVSFGFDLDVLLKRFVNRWNQRHPKPTAQEIARRNFNIQRLKVWHAQWLEAAESPEYRNTLFVVLEPNDFLLNIIPTGSMINKPFGFGGQLKKEYERRNLALVYARFWDKSGMFDLIQDFESRID